MQRRHPSHAARNLAIASFAILSAVVGSRSTGAQELRSPTVEVLLKDGRVLRGGLLADVRAGVLVDDAAIGRTWLPRSSVRWVDGDWLVTPGLAAFAPEPGPVMPVEGMRTQPAHVVGLARRDHAPGEILWIAAAPLGAPAAFDDVVRLLATCDESHLRTGPPPDRELADVLGAELLVDALAATSDLPGTSFVPGWRPQTLPLDLGAARHTRDHFVRERITQARSEGDVGELLGKATRALDGGATRVGVVVPSTMLAELEDRLAGAAFRTTRSATIDWRPRLHAPHWRTTTNRTPATVDGLDAAIAELAPPGARVSTWLGPVHGPVLHAIDPFATRAAASAIKTAYLVELFATFEDSLDAPLPGADDVLADPGHPALAHFSAEQPAEITRDLRGRSVRDLAGAMIHGRGVSNVVYNAAANLVTATLGGPAELSRRLERRFGPGAAVRRYMLARRDVTGDNEASAAWFARVLRRIGDGRLGVRPATVEAIRAVLFDSATDKGSRIHVKTGALDSDPMVRIVTELITAPDGTGHVIAVVIECDRPDADAEAAVTSMEAARASITSLLRSRL